MDSESDATDGIEKSISSPEELGRLIETGELAKGMLDGPPPVPVDFERLRAYHDGELSHHDKDAVNELVARYREWYEADLRIKRERLGIDDKA